MLARSGCRVAVHFHASADAAHDLVNEIAAAGGEAHAIQADLGNLQSIEQLFQAVDAKFGGLDYLVNNAAVFERVPFEQISPEAFDRMWWRSATYIVWLTP